MVKSGQPRLSTNQDGSSPKDETRSSHLDQSRSRNQELVEVTNRDLDIHGIRQVSQSSKMQSISEAPSQAMMDLQQRRESSWPKSFS